MESGNNIVSPTEDFSRHTHEPYAKLCPESLHIPYEFRCPISLVIMKDPVIICTGQTSDASSELIDPDILVSKLSSNDIEELQCAVVPSMHDTYPWWPGELDGGFNAETESSSHLFQPLWGGWEQNCNWCIWSNPSISCSILGGKVDAAKALLNLCLSQGNKGQAITAGIVPKLIEMLTEPDGDMRDEAFAVMAVVAAGHSDGQATIGSMNVVSTLVELVSNGPPRNKENATSVLVIL
ncbi:hypothetical protein JHK87_023438 [Glycine soja]|nr:hypothetical protein JHK87_023438 [Glycine soja]